MTGPEAGILLLLCPLGDPDAKPLTPARFRALGSRVRASIRGGDPAAALTARDLAVLGYDEMQISRILTLLDRDAALSRYLAKGEAQKIFPLTFRSGLYPAALACQNDPPVLFYRGDLSLLQAPAVSLVGSRALLPENEAFARTVGRLAAQEGLILISAGAAGADTAAMEACLEAGGHGVVFLPDRLDRHPAQENLLQISAWGYDLPFSAVRALERNTWIHQMGRKTFAAQCTCESGGTWRGCINNLRHRWSELYVFDDGSPAMKALMEQGATGLHTIETIRTLGPDQVSLF